MARLAQALAAAVSLTAGAVLTAGVAVTRTDPEQFPNVGVGLWWTATTVTTVGYGDVVPSSPAGRLVEAALMFVGIASLALLTAIAASAIVVGEVRSESHEIEREESEILSELREIARRMDRIEQQLHERRTESESHVRTTAPPPAIRRAVGGLVDDCRPRSTIVRTWTPRCVFCPQGRRSRTSGVRVLFPRSAEPPRLAGVIIPGRRASSR